MSKTGFLKVSFLIFCLFVALSPIRVSTQKGITQTLSLDPQNPVHRARIEQAKSETVAVNQVRQLLTSAQVPFDPLVLFSRNWRQKLAPVLARMPRATTAICSSPSGPTSLGQPTHSSGR